MLFDLECFMCEITDDQASIVRKSDVHSCPSPYARLSAFVHEGTHYVCWFRPIPRCSCTSQLQWKAANLFSFDQLSHDSPPVKLHSRFRRTQTVGRNDRNPVVHLQTTCHDIHQQNLCWTTHLFATTEEHTQQHIQLNSYEKKGAMTRSFGLGRPEQNL